MVFKIFLQVASGHNEAGKWIFEPNEPVVFNNREAADIKYTGWLAELPVMAYSFETAVRISFWVNDVEESFFISVP